MVAADKRTGSVLDDATSVWPSSRLGVISRDGDQRLVTGAREALAGSGGLQRSTRLTRLSIDSNVDLVDQTRRTTMAQRAPKISTNSTALLIKTFQPDLTRHQKGTHAAIRNSPKNGLLYIARRGLQPYPM